MTAERPGVGAEKRRAEVDGRLSDGREMQPAPVGLTRPITLVCGMDESFLGRGKEAPRACTSRNKRSPRESPLRELTLILSVGENPPFGGYAAVTAREKVCAVVEDVSKGRR